jgi:hypothetical protein
MAKAPDFDIAAAHKYFAAHCFNRAWDLIDKESRSTEEDRLLIALNQASIYHWMQRPDCEDERLSIGYWQASRIQALLGNAAESRTHAQTALSFSRDLAPFYLGYAYEALARAEAVAGNHAAAAEYIAKAREQVARVSEADDRNALLKDLDSI